MFRAICEALLYTHIVCDNLVDLLADAFKPARRRLLLHTKTLHVELSPKGEEPTYALLWREGGILWKRCGVNAKDREAQKFVECAEELALLIELLEPLSNMGMSTILPALRTIASCSIYGSDGLLWIDFHGKWGEGFYPAHIPMPRHCSRTTPPTSVAEGHWNTFVESGDLTHFCSRETFGPYCIAKLSKPNSTTICARTTHFTPLVTDLPVTMGVPVRWVLDPEESHDDDDWNRITDCMAACFDDAVSMRNHFPEMGTAGPTSIDVYCSTARSRPVMLCRPDRPAGDRVLRKAEQEEIVQQLQQSGQNLLRKNSGCKDVVRWHRSGKEPMCVACGAGSKRV